MSCHGCSKRVRSPSAATVVTATVNWTPRRPWRASTTGASRQVWTWVVKFLLKALKTGAVFGDGVHVFLQDDLLGRCRTDDFAEPSEVSRAPGGLARRADSVAQEKRLEPKLGCLEITDGLFTSPAQVPNRFILHRWDIDRSQVTRAHESGQLDRITTVGFDPVAGLLGNQ